MRMLFCLLAVLLARIAGCALPPDVSGFVDATHRLERIGPAVFDAVADLRESIAEPLDVPGSHPLASELHSRRDEYAALAERIRAERESRATMWRALGDYADAIAELHTSGRTADQSAERFARGIEHLGNQVGLWSGAGPPGVALFRLAVSEATRLRVARNLDAALQGGREVVRMAGDIVLADLTDLAATLATGPQAVRAALELAHEEELAYRAALETRRLAVIRRVAQAPEDTFLTHQLRDVEEELAAADRWFVPLVQRRDALLTRLRGAESAVSLATASVREWVRTHDTLAAALRRGGSIDAARLALLIREAEQAIADLRGEVTNDR
jgi:hypothetical protein